MTGAHGNSCRAADDLVGRRAVVTGATGSIGAAIVRRLLRAGVHVTAVDHDVGRLAAELGPEFGPGCGWVAGGLDGEADGVDLARRVVRSAGPVELVVHNHEVATSRDVLDLDEDDFDEAFNPKAPWFFVSELSRGLTAGARRGLRVTSGRIVFVAPAYADPYEQELSHVRATEACKSLTHAAAMRWWPGIRANMIEPGWVTDGRDPGSVSWDLWSGSPGTPDDVARLTACLLSDGCTRLVTGRAFGPRHPELAST